MDKEMLEQFQMIAGLIGDTNARIDNLEYAVTEIKVTLENDVAKKIGSLFDGYQLNHEKQWELERKTDGMQHQIDDLQVRTAALEGKPA